jgi:hypothetical protein
LFSANNNLTGINLSQSGNKIHNLNSSQLHMMPSRVLSSTGSIALNQPALTSASTTHPTSQSVAVSHHQSGAQTVTSQTLPTTVVTSRRANTSVTIINSHQQSNAAVAAASQVYPIIYKLPG